MSGAPFSSRLQAVASGNGYSLRHVPTVTRRGWPSPSAKPFHLCWDTGELIAAFATVVQLERNLRARAGC